MRTARTLKVLGAAELAAIALFWSAGSSAPVTAAAAPTFSKDVAPILYKSCVECHRQTGMLPGSIKRKILLRKKADEKRINMISFAIVSR